MGLSIDVGLLAHLGTEFPEEAAQLREQLAKVNKALEREGLPEHEEPESLPDLKSRCSTNEVLYSTLHHLRRFYARAIEDEDIGSLFRRRMGRIRRRT